jgi:nitrogen fixation negative regulator NifL
MPSSRKPRARTAKVATTDHATNEIPPALFRAAVEQSDIGIMITDAVARIGYVNPAFTHTTGYAGSDAIGERPSLLSNRATPPEVYRSMWEQLAGKQTWRGRLVNRRKNGRPYLADLTVTPVLDEAGNIAHFLGLHRDVTELHRLECTVRNQKALIESVVDSAPVALALLDLKDQVVLDNQAYKALMADLGMQEPAGIILDVVRTELGSDFGAFQPGAHAFVERQIRLDRPHWRAPRWFACSAVWVQNDRGEADAFYDGNGEPFLLLVAKDVSRQLLEQERARVAALQVLMSDETRRQELREGLAAAVYQMEGPLNVLKSVLAVMDRRGCDPAQTAMHDALKAGQAALDTLRSAVPPAMPETLATINLNELVRDVLDLSAMQLLATGISASWEPQTLLPSLSGMPTRLRSMLKALVDNAIDAMNTKGWRRRELTIRTRSREGFVEIRVEDSGPGLAAELRLKVFEPFFTSKKAQGNHLGTGLTAAQQTAADHGGAIELREGAQGGCIAIVVLPIHGNAGWGAGSLRAYPTPI